MQPVTKRERQTSSRRRSGQEHRRPRRSRGCTVAETWYDKGGAIVAGGKGVLNGLLQPGRSRDDHDPDAVQREDERRTTGTSRHANGTVKPHTVAEDVDGDAKDGREAAAKHTAKKKLEAKTSN